MAAKAYHLDERYHNFERYIWSTPHADVLPDVMIFAQMNDDVIVDKIPLIEIKQVQEMLNRDDNESKVANQATELVVETLPEGYNSGRTYYLSAESATSCQNTVQILTRYSKAAYKRANSQTVLSRMQQHLLTVAYSTAFQNIIALLIIMVSSNLVFASNRGPHLIDGWPTTELFSMCSGCAIQR